MSMTFLKLSMIVLYISNLHAFNFINELAVKHAVVWPFLLYLVFTEFESTGMSGIGEK